MFTSSTPTPPHHMERKSLSLCLRMELITTFYVIIFKFPFAYARFLAIMALCYRVQQQYPNIMMTPMHAIVPMVEKVVIQQPLLSTFLLLKKKTTHKGLEHNR